MSDMFEQFQKLYDAWRVKDLSEQALAHRKYLRDGKLPDNTGTVKHLSTILEKTGSGGTFDEIYSRVEPVYSGCGKMNLGWALMRLMQMGLLTREGDRIVPTMRSKDSPPA